MSGKRETARLPVIMYHSVGIPPESPITGGPTVPLSFFERQLRHLRDRGYRSISLDELCDRQALGRMFGDRLMVLTFDDGYLDNWVFAYPIMKRYGWVGTVYVNPDFVEPGEELRPTLEDVWEGRCALSDLRPLGFLNWGELRAMQASGVLEIGSHSMTHTWYPTGPEIMDFHRPGGTHPWLAWNARPDRKHAYLNEDQTDLVRFGTPVHVHGRSLGVRRYHVDADVTTAACEYVAARGGQAFFDRTDWRPRLDEVVKEADTGKVRYESEEEMLARYRHELQESRSVLERMIETDVHHLCWPGGVYNETSWREAEAVGYQTIVVNSRDIRRWLGADPRYVRRLSCYDSIVWRGRRFDTDDAALLFHACEMARGREWHRWPLRIRKAITAWRRPVRVGARTVKPWRS